MASAQQISTQIGGTLSGAYKALNELPASIENVIRTYDGLVLIREETNSKRTIGSIWYKGSLLGFTVEDPTTGKYVSGTASISANVRTPSNDYATLTAKSWKLTMDTTGNSNLVRCYVKFPNDSRTKFRSPGVFPRLGDSGIRIHNGSDEAWSSGCVIFSRTRKSNGTLVNDVDGAKQLTKFIYNTFGFNKGKDSSKFLIIDAFKFPKETPRAEATGIVIDNNTGSPIQGATIQPPETPVTEEYQEPISTPPPLSPPPAVGVISPTLAHLGSHKYLVKGTGLSGDRNTAKRKAELDAETQLYEFLNIPFGSAQFEIVPQSDGAESTVEPEDYKYTGTFQITYIPEQPQPPVETQPTTETAFGINEADFPPIQESPVSSPTSSITNTSNQQGSFIIQVPPPLQSNPNPNVSINPYRFEINFNSILDKWEARIYYNNNLALIEEYIGDFTAEIAGIKYTDPQQSILATLQFKAQNIGFTNSSTQQEYPSLTSLNNIQSPSSSQEGTEVLPNTQALPPEPIPTLPLKPAPLIITAPGYEPLEIIPYKGDGTPKDNLGVVQMTPTQQSLESDKITSAQYTENQIDAMNADKKDFKYHSQKKLNNSINDIKNKLIPVILVLVADFGVTGVAKLIEQKKNKAQDLKNKYSCPSRDRLINLINKKNKLIKQLNNTLTIIDSTIKALGIAGGIIEALNLAYQILKNLPTPSAVAGVGVPISVINNIQDAKDKIDKTITGLRAVNVGTLIILVILQQALTQALEYLNLLDSLIQECAPDLNVEQEEVSSELLKLTQQQSQQQSPVITNVNGFTLEVETEKTTNALKRRRSIAKNNQGVVILRGEWSFSSIDQILIDELAFYIQTNNLKAN
jgi:hypothetical protein